MMTHVLHHERVIRKYLGVHLLSSLDIRQYFIGDEHLPPVSRVCHTCRFVHGWAVVVHSSRGGGALSSGPTDFHAHVNAHSIEEDFSVLDHLLCVFRLFKLFRPFRAHQRFLHRQTPRQRLPSCKERYHEGCTFGFNLITTKFPQDLAEDAIMDIDRISHGSAIDIIPEIGDALHSRKHDRHRALGSFFSQRSHEFSLDRKRRTSP
mmetsp:Transcript_29434/g.46992  ORF Transcript_29434/g.46992 Transcript_29434/m.46992 type:complete len:206 (+) Transcript_29434:582-1199(+)